jgi:hypothetical protein
MRKRSSRSQEARRRAGRSTLEIGMSRLRLILAISAALALATRGILTHDDGGLALILVAAAVLVAVALRHFYYR